MARRTISGSRAVVTGASSGIGREIARQLCQQGAKVVATARRQDRLQELAQQVQANGGTIEILAGDITDPMFQLRVIQKAQEKFGGLDLLVNNAGVGCIGLFEQSTPARLREVMEVNFFALVEMTRLAFPFLKLGRQPMVVNIGSILGRRGVPYNTEYCASKFAVQGFSEALRAEWAHHGIEVLLVHPGTTDTEFFERVIHRSGGPRWPRHKPVSAEYVARKVLQAIRRGKHEIVPYPWGKVLLWLNWYFPRLTDWLMTKLV
ncbi:MAG: SDR family NAD(P)-dependent oxidoreductase [Thermoguttaceae bacterium]|nr:SDR family NAD(P)-dependent oxidoreductase [Thermoguttaceae bacterium]MDW8038022.1 SDR family NAD(P)-dependent oxidoreductase [Thermoguttaceae bacterium]